MSLMSNLWPPPPPALRDGQFHVIVEIWEPLSPNLRKYKLGMLMSKMNMDSGWTVHVPDVHDGPYGMIYSSNDKEEFKEIVLSLKCIKEGRPGMGTLFSGDKFAYTKLFVVTPEVPHNNNLAGAKRTMDDTEMNMLTLHEQSTDEKLEEHCKKETAACRYMGESFTHKNTEQNDCETILHDEVMEDADKALDEAILELDKEEKTAKEGFDTLVAQFELLTRDDTDGSSPQLGAL